MKKISIIIFMLLLINAFAWAFDDKQPVSVDNPKPLARNINIVKSVDNVRGVRVYGSNINYKNYLGELYACDGTYLKNNSISATPNTTREKCSVVAKMRNDGNKDGYLTFIPDECYGLSSADERYESLVWKLTSIVVDGNPVAISTSALSKEDDYTHDIGVMKMWGNENFHRQQYLFPKGAKSVVMQWILTPTKLIFTKNADVYDISSANTGEFRFRINPPKILDSDFNVISGLRNIITGELVDNRNGTWTYSKNITDASKVEIPEGAYIDAETVYSSTNDGYIWYFWSDWNTVHDFTGGPITPSDSDATAMSAAAYYLFTDNYCINRLFYVFSLSGLSGEVTEVNFCVRTAPDGEDAISACIQQGTQSDPIGGYDFDNFTGSYFDTETLSTTSQTLNTFAFNSTGKSYISGVLGSTAKLCMRQYPNDYVDTQPGIGDMGAVFTNLYFADETGTSKDPYLAITLSTYSGEQCIIINQ